MHQALQVHLSLEDNGARPAPKVRREAFYKILKLLSHLFKWGWGIGFLLGLTSLQVGRWASWYLPQAPPWRHAGTLPSKMSEIKTLDGLARSDKVELSRRKSTGQRHAGKPRGEQSGQSAELRRRSPWIILV